MEQWNEHELRALFAAWEVPEPCPALVDRTKRLMAAELVLLAAPAPARLHGWAAVLLGLSVALALSMVYTLTIGAVIRLFVPPEWAHILTRSFLVCAAAGMSMLAGTLMVGVFTRFGAAGSGRAV